MDRNAESDGLRTLRLAAILTLIGVVAGFVIPYAISGVTGAPNPLGGTSFINFPSNSTSTNSTLRVDTGAIWALAGVTVFGLAFGFIGLVIYRRAFQSFARVDGRFISPAKWIVAAMIGILLFAPAILLFFGGLAQANGCDLVSSSGPGSSGVSPCGARFAGDLLGALALIVLAAILALIGGIWLLIGIWRTGTRYDSTALKVAAICYIIPFIDIVAAILIIVETNSIERRIASGAPMNYAPTM